MEKFKLSNRLGHNKVGRGSGHQGATTRYLTRIITYLSELKTQARITDISLACFGGNSNRVVRDAIQWLVSNKIILSELSPTQRWKGSRVYSMNSKFEKLRNRIDTTNKEIKKAFILARDKHKGQLDDCGKDYFKTHLLPVFNMVSQTTDDIEVQTAAILHDIIEDTDITPLELEAVFGKRVCNLVMEVTHEGKKDSYGYYFPRLKTAEGILIKLCDRANNISRMESWSSGRRKQYLKKTKFWKDGSDKNLLTSNGKTLSSRKVSNE